MRVTDPRMAAGELVCRDVRIQAGDENEKQIKVALDELLSLLRCAPGHDTSSDRLQIWIVADGPNALSVWGVKGDMVGPSASKELRVGELLYDGSFDSFSIEQLGYPQEKV